MARETLWRRPAAMLSDSLTLTSTPSLDSPMTNATAWRPRDA